MLVGNIEGSLEMKCKLCDYPYAYRVERILVEEGTFLIDDGSTVAPDGNTVYCPMCKGTTPFDENEIKV